MSLHAKPCRSARFLGCLACIYAIIASPTAASALDRANRIDISYAAPKDPLHQPLADLLKERRVLEQLQRTLSPVRLPRTLTLSFSECGGDSNAFYHDDKVQVCYEMVDEITRNAPKQRTTAGIEPADAISGSVHFLFLHEISHALFDMLDVPLFGGEEQAADQLGAYFMLSLDKEQAKRLITGAAYFIGSGSEAEKPLPLKDFAGEHGFAAQRFFNLLCITYGADTKFFADFVEKGYLPKE